MLYCRTKKQQFLKTHVNNSKKRARPERKNQKPSILMKLSTKTVRKAARKHPSIPAPGRPSDRNITRHAPTQLRLARTHGTHDTHETKTKTKRSRSPGYGGRINCSNSPNPPMSVGQKWSGKNNYKSGRERHQTKIQFLGLYRDHLAT